MHARHHSPAHFAAAGWWSRGLSALAGWALTVTAAQAQPVRLPNPSPPPQTPIDAALPPEEEPGRWTPWTVGLSANQGYEGFESGGNESVRITTGLNGTVARSWLLRRGSIGFNGSAGETLYEGGQDQFMYGGGVTTAHNYTRRFFQTFAAAASRSYAEDSALLVNAGVVLPRVLTENQMFSTAANYQLTRRNSLEGSVSAARVSFPSATELSPSAPQLATDTSYTLRGAFARQLNQAHSLSVSFGTSVSTGASGDVQGLLANYTGRFGRTLTIIASGGVKPYRVANGAQRRYAPGALLGFSVGTLRDQTIYVSYEHTVEQAYGLGGTHLCDRFNSTYSLGFGRVSITGNANYGINYYPEVSGFTQTGGTLGVTAGIDIGWNLSLGANYAYAFNTETRDSVSSTVKNSRGSVSLGYAFSFR